jgi:ABC-2 type transport system permease protein
MAQVASGRSLVLLSEIRKLPAFVRRDLSEAVSYPLVFVSDSLSMIGQIVVFYFIGRMVSPSTLEQFGGSQVSYIEFVSIGIALTSVLSVGLLTVPAAVRTEQLYGTLEALVVSPTAPTTLQFGLAAYDMLYVPLRMTVFLVLVSVLFGAHSTWTGLGPAALILLAFAPLVWALGITSAAGVLTFRKGGLVVGFASIAFAVLSTTYFPIGVLPSWLQPLASANPVTIALNGIRSALLGTAGYRDVLPQFLALLPIAIAFVLASIWAFRAALRRERRRGTLGLY